MKVLDRLNRKITVENLWMYVVKSMLDKGEPVRAYEVRKMLREKFGLKVPSITVYTVVYRMAHEGLLEKRKVGSETLYYPTSLGYRALLEAVGLLRKTAEALSPSRSPDYSG
jgi:PadR family transcriptional regulator PadR